MLHKMVTSEPLFYTDKIVNISRIALGVFANCCTLKYRCHGFFCVRRQKHNSQKNLLIVTLEGDFLIFTRDGCFVLGMKRLIPPDSNHFLPNHLDHSLGSSCHWGSFSMMAHQLVMEPRPALPASMSSQMFSQGGGRKSLCSQPTSGWLCVEAGRAGRWIGAERCYCVFYITLSLLPFAWVPWADLTANLIHSSCKSGKEDLAIIQCLGHPEAAIFQSICFCRSSWTLFLVIIIIS